MNNLSRLVNYKEVIYDFDLTLAQINLDWDDWQIEVTKIYRKYDPKFKWQGFAQTNQNAMFIKFGRPLRDEMCKFVEQYEYKFCQGVIPNHQLINYIKHHPHQKHHILTSQNRLLLNKLLKMLKIEKYFDKVITRDNVFLLKPDPEGINQIIYDQNISDFIYCGDSKTDKQTAEAVHMDFKYISMPEK